MRRTSIVEDYRIIIGVSSLEYDKPRQMEQGQTSPMDPKRSKENVTQEETAWREDKMRFVDRSCPRRTRFNAALLVLISLGVVQLLFVHLPVVLSGPLFLLLALFASEFNVVHGPAMTRHKRAYFDVANVLETYQPRARTHGHLFQPEPPTPGVVLFADKSDSHDAENANSEFKNARDSHYANMYEHAIKMAKEMETMEKAAGNPQFDAGSEAPLVAADPMADSRKAEEKKKKEETDYKKQLEKPFSC